MKWTLTKTEEFEAWFETQKMRDQGQIESRLQRIVDHSHFGHAKDLGDGVAELKFNNGIRIYFAILSYAGRQIVLLLGGNKNGQQKDIKKAKALLARSNA